MLSGQKGPCRDIVCLNAAAAIVAGGKAANLRDGWRLAQESIDTGSALRKLEGLIETSRAA